MRIAIGSDHAGWELKARLLGELRQLGHVVVDLGARSATEPVDYPDVCFPVAEQVASGEVDRGIVLGGSGNGEAIASNKVPGVRAAVVTSEETARLSRAHNDANVLALGARTNPDHDAVARWVEIWLETPFEGGRHARRLEKIREYEHGHPTRR